MRSVLLFTALVASALAGPTGYRESCAVHCSQDNIFSYQPGLSYGYEYSVTTNTALLGDSDNGATVTITAQAHIDVTAPCEHTLRLTDVSLQGSTRAEEMAAALTRTSLRFSFQDGRVEELCAAPTEDIWVLNLKRGVLSAFQTSLTRPGSEEVQETDVQGVCLTHYDNKLEGDLLTVTKQKDLSSCTKRPDFTSYLASASSSYNTDSPVQSWPLLDSTSGCRQIVEGGILTESSCEETHTFRPFSGQTGGASTTATSRLRLVSRDGPVPTSTEQQFTRRTPVFETLTGASPHSQAEAVTALLTHLDEVSSQEVRPEAPALFSRLVIALRGLDYPVLSKVYADTTNTHSRKFLVDAMPLVGTAAAAAVVRDMYTNGDLSQEEADAWFTSLTFLKNPTSDMFTAIAPMLERDPSQSAMLGTSALVNTFCKINSRCGEDSGVQQVMRRVEAQLGSGCRALNEQQKVKILVALRALGNAGRWVNAKQVLERCYTENNDMEVRVAAIEAWRHTPCEYDRANLLAAYQDEEQDSEVRIAAYLSVMTCPTPAVVAAVKDRLTSEGVNQVGSFVWTHLTNLQESAAPGKEWARVLLGEELLANKFNTQALRFSRNYESSFFMNELNVGASVESNVIFSSKSFLPRSGMLNLTMDLFGESVNLFEVGGRIEGFESYLERLFGPDGHFPEETVAAALRGLRQQKRETEATTLEQFLEEATDEPRGSYYLRLFGNDVHYRHFRGLGSSDETTTSPFALLMELARGGKVDYTKSYQLLDTHYSVPTVTGLPLTLGAQSTATVALRMDGSFSIQSLTNVDIQGHLRPSAAVHVDGVMVVDAHVTRAGVKVSSTMHTSTSLEGKVRVSGGTLVDVAFDTPKERTEFIDMETKYFYVRDDKDEEMQKEEPVITTCGLDIMGMQLCKEVAIPSSSCFSLPTTLKAYLKKTDTQTGYTLRYTKTTNEISLLFDSPGAQNSRRVALSLEAHDNKLLARMDSFFIKAEMHGEYVWQHDRKSVKTEVQVGENRLLVKGALLTAYGEVLQVEPSLELSMNGEDLFNTKALVIADTQQNKYSLQASFYHPLMREPISLKATFEKHQEGDATTYSVRMNVDDRQISLEYDGTISPSDMNTKFVMRYGPIDFLAEETWSHTYENGVRNIKGTIASSSEHLGFNTKSESELTLAPNAILFKSKVEQVIRFEPLVQTLLIDLQRDPGTSLTAVIDLDSTNTKFIANADLRKANPGHYTGLVQAKTDTPMTGKMTLIDASASMKDNSQPGTFNVNAEVSATIPMTTVTLTSEMYGDRQQGKINLQTQIGDKEFGLRMEATPSSLLIDANVVKHVVVNAKINPQGQEKTLLVNVEWDKTLNPDNTFKIEGKIQPGAISAEFRFLDKQFSAAGRLMREGVEVEANWSPSQRVAATLRYSLDAAPSLTAAVDTTFPGWEKQSVDITTSLQDNEITCRASATWKNSQQATLSVKGRLQPSGSVHAEVMFTSTVADLERLSLSFDHEMAGAAITSSLQGVWNHHELNGSLQLAPSDSGVDGLATFISPFTQPFKAVLAHTLQDASQDTTLLVSYGSTELVHLTSAGRLSLAPGQHDVDLALKLRTQLEVVPDMEATVKYTMDGAALSLQVDGKAGQRKMMLSVTGQHTVTGDTTNVSGELRFLTPFTQPLTASLSHTHDSRRFTSQFEVTRIWSTYSFGSLKMHAEGHMLSQNDINLSAYISSPETKGSFSFTHKIENNNLTTSAKVYANRELLSVSVTGTLDAAARLLSLEGDVTSSFEELEMKVKVDSRTDGNTQNTQVTVARGAHQATLTHSFTATDALNWESVLTLNEHYTLRNKMARVGEEYQHETDLAWPDQRLALHGRLTPVLTASSRKLDAHLALATPWECLRDVKIDLHSEQQTAGETRISAEVEYKPGSKILLSTRNNYSHEGQLFSAATLTTPFWQPLGYSLTLTLRPEKTAVLVLTRGQVETTVRLAGDYHHDRANISLGLTTPSLQHPLEIEASYVINSPAVSVAVAATYHGKYEAKVTLSGSATNATCELDLWESYMDGSSWTPVHHFEGRWQHQLQAMPFNVNGKVMIDSATYQAAATLEQTAFTSTVVLDGREGSLAATWLLQPTNTNLSLAFQSPVHIIQDFNVVVAYDVAALQGQAKVKYGSQEVDLRAKMEDQTFVFEGKTPFAGWEVLGASFFASGTAINAHVLRNERKIEVTGTQHLRPAKGKVELVVTTPYQGYETVAFDASYNFLGENKTIKFKAVYGTAEFFAKGVVKMADPLTPKVTLNITTPFAELRTLRASANWSLGDATKTAAAKVVYNEQEFNWNLEVSLEGNTQQLTSRVTSPFPGWTQAAVQASISVAESPYQVRVTVQKEGVNQDFSGRLMLSANTIQGEVKTPIPGWEVVALDGTYAARHDSFSAAIRATRDNDNYEVNTDVSFSALNPKLKVAVTTPFAQAASLQLEVESRLSEPQKILKTTFSRNEVVYSAEVTFRAENKTGFLTVNLRSPLPGLSSLEVEGTYDLRGDIKKSEVNVTKEGERQHFAVAATLNDNHVVLDVATPFPGFQVIKMDADYTSSALGQHLLVANFVKDRQTYNFQGSVELRGTGVEVRLTTPITPISRVVLNADYTLLRGTAQGFIHFERNDDVFELRTQCHLQPSASSFSVAVVTPVSGWTNLALDLKYNAEPNKLAAKALVRCDDFQKQVSVEATYGAERGSVTVRTPLSGWETLGAEYTLTVTSSSEAKALVKVIHNTREFAFSAYGRYTQESITLKFQTPLQGYEESVLDATINVATRNVRGMLQVGSYAFSTNASYVIGDMLLEVTTPFPALRFGSVALKHAASPGSLQASVTVVHNKDNYFLVGEASVAPRGFLAAMQTKTPIAALPNATLKLQANLDNKAELVTAQFTAGERSYSLLLAGDLQESLAVAKVEMTTPFIGWTQVKFETKVDMTQDDKTIEVVVEREGDVKAISIHGKLIGSDLSFDLRTPFTGLNRLNMSGSVNRAKRSVAFQMMNDQAQGSILASFNCVKFELKTPFARMEEVSFEIKREGDTYEGMWKRNDNYLMLQMVKNPETNKVNLEIKSELQGWEFLALAGRLDQRTVEAYASGQINEKKVELKITGERDDNRRTRHYELDLKTPYDDYQHVTGQLRFSPRRRMLKIESNSSNFKMEFKSSRRLGMELQMFVPNQTQNTELNVNLKPEGGNIDFTSRFEFLRSLHYNYALTMGKEIEMTQRMEVNSMEIFTMELRANPETDFLHLDIHGRLEGRHTNFHIHREGFQTFNVILKREVTESGHTTTKQLSLEMTGNGNLPQQGMIHVTLTNSFAAVPRTSTVHIELDRTSSPKHVKIEVTLPGSKLYVLDINYNIDLRNPSVGDFEVSISTPDRQAAPWKNFSGRWDIQDPQQAMFEFDLSGRKYKGEGIMSPLVSDLVFTADGEEEKFFLQWRFLRSGNQRDYYVKVGPESSYRMAKLKGSIQGIQRGNIEGGFKLSFQPDEFHFTTSWNLGNDGTFSSQGDFTYGEAKGSHQLMFHRDAASRSATFSFTANSSHSSYQQIELSGNYDVLNKFVFNTQLTIRGTKNRTHKINIDISDLNPRRSRNSIEVELSFLPPEFQRFQMTLNHDFRNNNNKYIKAEAVIGERESHLNAVWKRSDDFSVLEGNLDINSMFIGEVAIGMKYNVENINDALAEIHYKRTIEGEPEKRVNARWTRKRTPNHLETELVLDSTFESLQNARAYATADFSQLFNLNAGLDFNDQHITIVLNVSSEAVDLNITTPFEGFESIKGTINYSLGGKTQRVVLTYERGSQKADMELIVTRKKKKSGNLSLALTTPFEVLRNLKINASWGRRQATVDYVRNDVHVTMTGTAQLDADKSQFNLSFTAPSGKAVTIAAAYDVQAFIAGRGSRPIKLAGLTVDIGDTRVMFELKGFRSDERLYVEINSETSFLRLRHLHLKLDSELNTQQREGTFEFRLNDFVFEVHNEFVRYDDGYYIKSRVESSLTPLPALVFGLGRRGDERIFTLGYGEEKELTFSIKAKNNFRSGFSGSVDIPNFGYNGVQYDVNYRFPSNDELEVKLEAQLGADDHLEAEFEYNSDGVKARLMSPFTGEHSARVRRSISSDSFFTEVGFDDFNLRLRGGFKDGDIKRGIVLEADILGRLFLFNYQLQSEGPRYTEGKLVLQTPFRGWEKMGGMFTFSNVNKQVVMRAEVFVPFFLNIPRITAGVDLDHNNDKIVGQATLDVAGEQFLLRTNLVGSSLVQGFQGSVTLQTPFHTLPSLEVAGKFKMPSIRNLEADLKFINMYGTYEVDLSYEVTQSQVKANATILPGHLIGNKISLQLESLSPTQKKLEVRVDEDYITAEYTLAASTFTVNMDTRLSGVQRQLSISTKYSTLDDLEGAVVAVLGEQRHKVQGALSIADGRVRGGVLLDSSFIGGVRRLDFNTSMPGMSFNQVTFSVSLTATQTYAFSMDLDTRAGVMATAQIDTPALPSTSVNLQLSWPRTALTVTTPMAKHTAAVSWRQTRKMPADQIVNVELDTPLLGQRYALRMVMGGGRSKAVVKAELEVGSVTHHLEANTYMGATSGGFSLSIQTPFMNIQKAALQGSLDMSDTVELQAVASVAEVTNTFIFIYNANKGTLLAEAASPYIPTGLVKATAEVSGALPNLGFQVALMNAQDVISGRLDIKAPSTDDITIRATVTTPLESFKTMNGLIKYQKTDVTQLIISLDHPITFRAAAKFANTSDKFTGNLTVKTSITNFEYLEADLEIPLTEFSPRATLTLPTAKYGIGVNYATEGYHTEAAATIYMDNNTYGGTLGFRSKAPYELAYKYHIFNTNSAFHLRTDSSFLTLLM
nr:dLp/HDL-BGBP protein [Scylla paramamosain]